MTKPKMSKPSISKNERDKVMSTMTNDQRADFGRMMQEIKSEAKSAGGAKTKQGILEARKGDCSEELQKRLDAVMRRDQMGPHEGEAPPNFNLRRMGSGDRVELASFKGHKPVALVFGSYT